MNGLPEIIGFGKHHTARNVCIVYRVAKLILVGLGGVQRIMPQLVLLNIGIPIIYRRNDNYD